MDRKPIIFEEDLFVIYELHSYHVSDGSPFFEREVLVGKSQLDLVEQISHIGEFSSGLIGNNIGECRIKIYLFKPHFVNSEKITSDVTDVTDLFVAQAKRLVKQVRLHSDLKSIEKQIEELEQKKDKIQREINYYL